MGKLRTLLEAPLRAVGVEMIPTWKLSAFARDHVHADLLREIFEARQVDCVFDVGAFNGHFGRFLREAVGFRGLILSFEPQPTSFDALRASAERDDRWHAFPYALGAASGEFSMNVMNKPWFSSFLPPSTTTPHNMAGRNAVEATVQVRVERLSDRYDALAADHGFNRPFLKMDTQGFDLRVFQGAAARIDRFLGLQSEVSVIPIYDGMPSWQDAIAEYRKCGFELSGMYPVSHDGHQRVVEFDAVMVRGGSTG